MFDRGRNLPSNTPLARAPYASAMQCLSVEGPIKKGEQELL
jgi:hypothetical protein